MKRVAVLAATSAALAAPRLARAQNTLLPVKVGIPTTEAYGEALYAHVEDFYKANGLDAQPYSLNGAGAAMTLAVVSGTLDVAIGNVGSVASAHVHDIGLYMIAPCALYTAGKITTVLAVPPNSTIQTAKDFEGKTIGVSSLGDLVQAATMAWLDANGASSKAVAFVELGSTSQMTAMASNRVAGAVVTEPVLNSVKNQIRIIGLPYETIAQVSKSILISGWIANKAWFDGNPEGATRLLATIRQTAKWANANPAATAAILADTDKIPLETLAGMTRSTYAESRSFAAVQAVIDVMAKYGMLARPFNAAELFPPSLRRDGPI